MLGRVFGTKRDGVTGEWRKLPTEELNDLYCSNQHSLGDQIENNDMGGTCSADVERCIQGFGEETWGKETMGETRV
jgi:hypothetical protein